MSTEPCGADVAAYSLGALSEDEARDFERHLRTCAVCAEELAAFGSVVEAVAASAPPMSAPRSLRHAVMSEVRSHAPEGSRRRTPRVRLGFGGALFAGGVAFAVAAVLVAVIALPGRMADRTIPAQVTGQGSAHVRVSGGHADLVLDHFAAPPAGKIYEVWLQRGTRDEPTSALFSVARDGDATVSVPGSLYGVSHVLVTPEPAPDGSRHPTHAPVISAAVYQ